MMAIKSTLVLLAIQLTSPQAYNLGVSYRNLGGARRSYHSSEASLILKRTASFSDDFILNGTSNSARLEKIRGQILATFEATRVAVKDEVAVINRDNLFLAVSNFIGTFCFMANAAGGEMNLFALSFWDQVSVVSKGLLGYGYSAPFSASFERPVLCSKADLEKVFSDYSFLDRNDTGVSNVLKSYYATEMNNDIKRKLFCISKKKYTNASAREFFGLVDLYTSIQKETFVD